ncbi:hypothetical protein PG996_005801 [Apiospora saccharicola]|uniref:Protein phosphatase 4 core regulatory subunit R2 n=1 Tax=Apiospora saccharicola TaxID=335842 RepID=A0ABR1VRJ0_9PEZI
MMDIDEYDLLNNVAATGTMDYSMWPALLPRIVSRIEKIAHDDFPIPQMPSPAAATNMTSMAHHPATSDTEGTENFLAPLPSSPTEPPSTTSSQETNKENTPVRPRATAPAQPAAAAAAVVAEPLPPGTFPPQVTAMLNEITTTLTSTFPTYPPHSIQRLAELVLTPKHHYKSLPTYLHALDRVVHVTSGLNVYPLPPAVPDASSISLLPNGATDAIVPSPWAAPGSDEALGGALLTPIPWLQHGSQGQGGLSPTSSQTDSSSAAGDRANDSEGELRTESTETIDGPNGMGSIETVTVTVNGVSSMGARVGVGVTQGELLRQEQRAGVVPVSQLVPTHHIHPGQFQQQQNTQQQQQQQQQLEQQDQDQDPDQQQDQASDGASPSTTVTMADDSSATAENNEGYENDTAEPPVSDRSEDERPHARGPEEIGAEDMGPQRESSSSANYGGGAAGLDMHGIDVEAAVGRKASETRTSPDTASTATVTPDAEDANSKAEKDDDEMEGVETAAADKARSLTPKREAEDELEGTSKKLKEDTEESTTSPKEDDKIKTDEEDAAKASA